MAAKNVRSYFISKKAEKKDSQVQITQLVKTSDNVTVAEVSAMLLTPNQKIHAKKRKNTKLTCLRKSKTKLAHFRGKYQQ